mmetsp:Transcript_21006/g.68753  ORF Transcript_21006/g.68753 Transcript_21006/m.68753 type:complete len:153 (+) Transcript_21006:47-505(+)
MAITAASGKAFAEKFMTQFAAGFKENNHATTLAGLLAEKISWDWSDDSKGDGTPDDLTGMFSKSWGAMVDSFNLLAKQVVVDTTHSKVLVTGQLIINITGGLADETNLVHNDICFIFTLNDKEQVTHWEGYWDQADEGMTAALGKVMAKLKA